MSLTKRVFHECETPEVEDTTSQHRYVCPVCESVWEWNPSWLTVERVHREHRWSRPVIEHELIRGPGHWRCESRTSEWVEVQP